MITRNSGRHVSKNPVHDTLLVAHHNYCGLHAPACPSESKCKGPMNPIRISLFTYFKFSEFQSKPKQVSSTTSQLQIDLYINSRILSTFKLQ